MAPHLSAIHTEMKKLSDQQALDMVKWCSWMHHPGTIQLCFHMALHQTEELVWHECLLLLTASLERSLGNVRPARYDMKVFTDESFGLTSHVLCSYFCMVTGAKKCLPFLGTF